MADVHFHCPACEQKLVVDEGGVGLTIHCPHCNKVIQIPFPEREPLNDAPDMRTRKSLAKWINRATTLESDLVEMRKRFEESERLIGAQRIALAENLQRLRTASAEMECFRAQSEEEKSRRKNVEFELETARTEMAAMEQLLNEIEAARQQLELRVQRDEIDLAHLRNQLGTANAERTELIADIAQQKSVLADALSRADALRQQRQELEAILQRARTELSHAQEQSATLASEKESLSTKLSSTTIELVKIRRALEIADEECTRLRSDIEQNKELSKFLAVKSERDHLEKEMRDSEFALADTRAKLEAAQKERDGLRQEKVDLQLRVAAVRDSHSDEQLLQDNEMLRRLVERLNEELKELAPLRKKHHRKAEPPGRVGEIARGLLSRCFVSDPDTP